jgi:hypothetical protein
MSSQRFTGRPEYETMELLFDIVRKATWSSYLPSLPQR